MVSKWCMSLLVLVVAAPAFADKPQTNMAPFSTPAMVIHPDESLSVYRTKFQALVDKNSYWSTEVQKQGFDLAFTEWLLELHPWEFAAICTNAANKILKDPEMSAFVASFRQAVTHDATLQSQIASTSEAVAFLDWLRAYHQAEYKHALVNAGISDASSRWAHEKTYGWGPSSP